MLISYREWSRIQKRNGNHGFHGFTRISTSCIPQASHPLDESDLFYKYLLIRAFRAIRGFSFLNLGLRNQLAKQPSPIPFSPSRDRALSSVVEHILHTDGVAGSNPAARTIPPSHPGTSWPVFFVQLRPGTHSHRPDQKGISLSILVASSNCCMKAIKVRYIHQQIRNITAVITIFQATWSFGWSQTKGTAKGGTVTKVRIKKPGRQYHGTPSPAATGATETGTGRLDLSRNSMQCRHLTASSWISSAQ
jgi:hypothetical protein